MRTHPSRRGFAHGCDSRLPLLAWINGEIAALNPGCFAIVMATGIVAKAMSFGEHRTIGNILFAVSALVFVWLVFATVFRAVRFHAALWADTLAVEQRPLAVYEEVATWN